MHYVFVEKKLNGFAARYHYKNEVRYVRDGNNIIIIYKSYKDAYSAAIKAYFIRANKSENNLKCTIERVFKNFKRAKNEN
ncbi:MAG: hypothetical protein RLZZ292_1946 [Bacteroidota bacterium]|jgi:uncharacterized protein with PIN domain